MTIDFSDIENNIQAVIKKVDRAGTDIIQGNNDSLKHQMTIIRILESLSKSEAIEKIDKAINELLNKDYSPTLDVKVDNTELVSTIHQDNRNIIMLLTEIQNQLNKRPTGFEFERDSQGFIKSPIKITYGQ